MSSNMEDSDGNLRVTRGSLRRMASNESLTDLENRADTPRVLRKLNIITENVSSPRRIRKNSEDSIASPFRRTTRASSQEVEIAPSPIPTRSTRRSLIDSDTDDISSMQVEQKISRKSRKNERKSMIVSPTIDLIEEEPEEEVDAMKCVQNVSISSGNSSKAGDELELRNRSISKSPNINSSRKSANSSLNEPQGMEGEGIGVLDETMIEEEPLRKIFKSRNTKIANSSEPVSGDDTDCSGNLVPIKKFVNKRLEVQISKQSFDEAYKKYVYDKTNGTSKTIEEEQIAKSEAGVSHTPVRKRRSIHGSLSESLSVEVTSEIDDIVTEKSLTPKSSLKIKKTPAKSGLVQDEVSKLMEDFVPDNKDLETPKSLKKSEKTPKKTPAKSEPVQDEVSKLIEDFVPDNKDLETPKSSKKSEKTPKKTPAKSEPVQDEVSKLITDFVPDIKTAGTPKISIKVVKIPKKTSEKSPANGNQTVGAQDMDISQLEDSNMDIVLSTPDNVKPSNTTKFGSNSRNFVRSVLNTITSQFISQPTPDQEINNQPGSPSLTSYLEQTTNFKRRSWVETSKNDEKADTPVKEKLSRSWGQSVVYAASETIDKLTFYQPKIVKASPVQHVKSISSDESEDEGENNLFIDDEAEVGSTQSITESERQYLKDNELPEEGESIGSQDSNEIDSDEDIEKEEEDVDSFIDNGDISDTYSMNSDEKRLEKSPLKKKRQSRIIIQSDSSDNENEEKSPSNAPKLQSSNVEEVDTGSVISDDSAEKSCDVSVVMSPQQPQQVSSKKNKLKRKRAENDADASIPLSIKRVKVSHDSTLTGMKALFKEESSNDEMEDEEEFEVQKPVKSKKSTGSVDVESVLNKCNELMDAYNESKKSKKALKREKKAIKLAKKQQEAESLPKPEGLDSSNGSNKENVIKKKKKAKAKKQKPVDEMPEKKEDLATSVTKLQEKMERKRQRKIDKKLAKQQESADSETTATDLSKHEKKVKKSKPDSELVQPSTSNEQPKKKKIRETAVELPAPEAEKPKKKKSKEPMEEENANVVSNKKKNKRVDTVEEPEEILVKEKKKSKKRKREEAQLDNETDAPKPKKKLNVLMQIEDPSQYPEPLRKSQSLQSQDQNIFPPMASTKLKKIIPQKLEEAKKKRKKKSNGKRVIAEPPTSLPRPVWTASGVFIEQPVSPFKFKTTKYVPIRADSSTKFGVITFEGKQKKKQSVPQQPFSDFKSQAIFRSMKARDGSTKNILGLGGGSHKY